MKSYFATGNLPHKLDESLNLQSAFRGLTQKVIIQMFEILNDVKVSDYPYTNYSLPADSEGINELGIQLTIESDIFGTDQLMLRRHYSGYTLVMLSIDDNIGSMEYEFTDDDPLVTFVPKVIQDYMSDNRI